MFLAEISYGSSDAFELCTVVIMDQNHSARDQFRPESTQTCQNRFIKIRVQTHKRQRRQIFRERVGKTAFAEDSTFRPGQACAYLLCTGIAEVSGQSPCMGNDMFLHVHICLGKAGKGIKQIEMYTQNRDPYRDPCSVCRYFCKCFNCKNFPGMLYSL